MRHWRDSPAATLTDASTVPSAATSHHDGLPTVLHHGSATVHTDFLAHRPRRMIGRSGLH